MEGRECCVKNCDNSSHDHCGRMLPIGLSFHCFPAWRTKEGSLISELTRRRRAAWVAAVGRRDITFDCIPSSMRVCSRHFVSGKPAYEMLDSDPDWVPSLHLGHNVDDDEGEGKSRTKRRKLLSGETPAEDGVAEVRKPAPPPWKEVKSALQCLLQSKAAVTQQSADGAQNRAAGRRTDASFRDFFRNALESSLEASIQSRARSRAQSSSAEFEVKLNFKLPPPDGEPATGADDFSFSSSGCANCSRMLGRIAELEHKLFELNARQQHANGDGTGTGPDQRRHGSERDQNTYELTGRVQRVELQDISSDSEPDSEAAPFSSESSSSSSDSDCAPSTSRPPPPPRPRLLFRSEWLEDFSFLRYSPSLNLMWCHVCRVHADPIHRNWRLIRGSNHFTKKAIMKHSSSSYHQQNVKRFLWSSGNLPGNPSDRRSTC
ncbi:uncharacterized protein LOC105929674 isoform X2 [Fundulus heteroclitus]|uniref:uncharacterized protein LOC105929674 isoform X2 n=1 Tax=Fundulus heteroclitus TaxID=8078 RepID=UPI00165C1DCB|nr:uncharacterized protein LOC105929674 isoform X2 [Fundulus heteroclitus]